MSDVQSECADNTSSGFNSSVTNQIVHFVSFIDYIITLIHFIELSIEFLSNRFIG